LTAVAGTLLRHRKDYYKALELASQPLDVTAWLLWFASQVLEAQQNNRQWVELIVYKAKVFHRIAHHLNTRQEKALLRLFDAGPEGFLGGLSARNYQSITGATSATTTRDLVELVQHGVLYRTGTHKSTRYHLVIPSLI
jgi:Fic family protein